KLKVGNINELRVFVAGYDRFSAKDGLGLPHDRNPPARAGQLSIEEDVMLEPVVDPREPPHLASCIRTSPLPQVPLEGPRETHDRPQNLKSRGRAVG
ncbi:hypothetical protein, partial [Acidiphilium sp.]